MHTSSTRLEQSVMDFIDDVEASKRADIVQRKFQAFISSLGFDNAACLELCSDGLAQEEHVLMNTRPAEWTDSYFECDHVKRDPVVSELDSTWVPFSWAEVKKRRVLTPDETEIIDSARDFGMKSGFVVPIMEGSGYSGIVSCAGGEQDLNDSERGAITLASFYTHHKLLAFKRKSLSDSVPLTKREQECLSWVAAGKSDWQIGQILSVSQKTVNFHVENVKRKFGVATRMQAVVTALRRGLLKQ